MEFTRRHWLKTAACGILALSAPPVLAAVPIARDPHRIFEKELYSWKSLRDQNVVMQQFDYSCGAASLATLCRYFWGDNITEKDVLEAVLKNLTAEELKDRQKEGLSMTDLRKAAVKLGYVASIGKRDLVDLRKAKVPVIVRISKDDYDHFVVFKGMIEDRVFLADPVRGNIRMSIPKFLIEWNKGSQKDGVIFVVAKPNTKPPEDSPLLVRDDRPSRLRHELQAPLRSLYLQPLPHTWVRY